METRKLNEAAYSVAQKYFKEKTFEFNDLWLKTVKYAKVHPNEQSDLIGGFYSALMQDTRFIYVGNQNWRLREYFSLSELKNIQTALYDFDTSVKEESYDPSMDVKTIEVDEGFGNSLDADYDAENDEDDDIQLKKQSEEEEEE